MTTTASPAKGGATRTEKDTMGTMSVPAQALYGASTQRAVENFPISGRSIPAGVLYAYGHLKAACAKVNLELGRLNKDRAEATIKAATEIGMGKHHEHFPIDVFQTGSGTSTNMNANEVIANLVCEANGVAIGSSKDATYIGDAKTGKGVHPNDHVNLGQSSNDTFPTAMRLAAAYDIHNHLLPCIKGMAVELETKAKAWDDVVKIGRTHLQDATPIRLGQEFAGYAQQLRHAEQRAQHALDALLELPIGGTAVGTGINTHPEFGARVCEKLSEAFGIPFREATDHCEAQHTQDAVVEASGNLRTIAISLSKIACDIRIMGCGPRCGIGELKLPETQPGSSIMPGKVNPVMVEMVCMVCCRVIGNDATIGAANMGGIGSILDLNVAMPVMAEAILDSIRLVAQACKVFTDKCLKDLEPDRERCAELIEGSLAMCTSLVPAIGYDKSAAIAKTAFAQGKTVREVAREQKVLSEDELDRLLNPRDMTLPN